MSTYRYPNITGDTDTQQLQQLKSYLYQLVEQLNNTPSLTESRRADPEVSAEKEKTPAETFASLKGLIMKSADISNAYCDKVEKKLSGIFVPKSEHSDDVREIDNTILATAAGMEQNYTRLEQIVTGLQTREQEKMSHIRIAEDSFTLRFTDTDRQCQAAFLVGGGVWGVVTALEGEATWEGTEGVSLATEDSGITVTLPEGHGRVLILSPDPIEI